MRSIIKSLEHIIYPQYCQRCDIVLTGAEQLFCSQCNLADIIPTRMGNWVRKLQVHQNLDYAVSFFWFSEIIQAYIHHLKYSGWSSYLPNLIKKAFAEISAPAEVSRAVLLPIPLHRVKQRDRGFNQALLIAKEIALQWNLPIDTALLRRKKFTKTQTALSIEARQKNMEMAFEVSKTVPRSVLLVDDVLTTGSTADACAAKLRENGCNWVGIVTLATPSLKNKYR